MFFVESSENSHLCPVCQGMLRYRDSRPRIRKKEGGRKEHLMIRRFRNCQSYYGMNFRTKQSVELFCAYPGFEINGIAKMLCGIMKRNYLKYLQDICKYLR